MAKVRDDNSHVVPTLLQDRLIFSTHLYWELKANIGIGVRYAMRLVLDEEGVQFSNKSKTTLMNIRTEYHWDLDWSAIVDMRILNLSSLREKSFGLALEIDRTMAKNTQVGLGYVLSSFNDSDFSFQNYSYSNIYLTLNMKFSEDIFNWR